MPQFKVLFGGMKFVEADSEGDAYAQFYQWVKAQIDDNNFGLVVAEMDEVDTSDG